MNLVQQGYSRDKRILQEIEDRGAMLTEQVAMSMFRGTEALKKCQQRLKKLADKKRVKRSKIDASYVYYVDKKSGRLEHLIGTNWVYIWLKAKLSKWESWWYWQYEMVYPNLRCDGFAGIKNTFTNEIKFYFVELDRSNNIWDKTVKYNDLYESGGYEGSFWVPHAKSFPAVLCVTESQSRKDLIEKSIREENKNNLNFKVMLLEDVIREVYVKWKQQYR